MSPTCSSNIVPPDHSHVWQRPSSRDFFSSGWFEMTTTKGLTPSGLQNIPIVKRAGSHSLADGEWDIQFGLYQEGKGSDTSYMVRIPVTLYGKFANKYRSIASTARPGVDAKNGRPSLHNCSATLRQKLGSLLSQLSFRTVLILFDLPNHFAARHESADKIPLTNHFPQSEAPCFHRYSSQLLFH